ncbi:MAG: hypothetical protein M1834_000759 [Cirrosporium novae-zelandiae]|nr:MAG: hypothetical protein M1834_000759 [Cirrosporium novae-zelandiae]
MSGSLQFEIPLFAEGDQGAAFRLRNEQGEMQRTHIIQEGSELTVQGDFFSIVHGVYTPGGDPASLVVIDFRFMGSSSRETRFKTAKIEIKFAALGTSPDEEPEVKKIAPHGTFFLNPSTETVTTTLSANASAGAGAGPVTLGIGAGWERTKTNVHKARTTLMGTSWIDGRDTGKPNMGRWKLSENKIDKLGIPGFLRTAILVVQRVPERFQALVTVEMEVNLGYKIQEQARRFMGRRIVDTIDPVFFDEGAKRQPAGAQLTGIDTEHLGASDLEHLSIVRDGQTLVPHAVSS